MQHITRENLSFSVDARLIKELGEKLVTRDYLALAELIKNSYDADSDKVELNFVNVATLSDQSMIVIKDYGTGMSWDEVKKNWMRVSTANKISTPVSNKYGRKKTGNKGIGRFSCQKLANAVKIQTTSKLDEKTAQVIKLTIEWDDLDEGKDLIDTTFESERYIDDINSVTIGTTITLYNLKQKWTQHSYSNLQRQLASLSISFPTRRQGHLEDPGFKILVTANEFESKDYSLSEKVLDAGWGRAKGYVQEDGTVKLDFDGKLIGARVYNLKEKFPLLKHASFDITCLSEKKLFQRDPKLMTYQQMKIIKESYSGVKVYSEGFRVYPYGQIGDDWLELDRDVGRRKAKIDNNELAKIAEGYGLDKGRVLLDLFSNRSIVGAITIDTNNNPEFEIKLNREGFVPNEAYQCLVKLLRHVIEWMTVQYSYFKYIQAERELEIAAEQFKKMLEEEERKNKQPQNDLFNNKSLHSTSAPFDITPPPTTATQISTNTLEVEHRPPSTIQNEKHEKHEKDKFEQAVSVLLGNIDTKPTHAPHTNNTAPIINQGSKLVDAAKNYIIKEYDSNKNELTLLRAIASTGPLFFVFAHEFKSLVSHLDTNAGKIEQWVSSNKLDDTAWLLGIAESLRESRKRFLSLENLISVFASTHKTEKKKIKVKEAIEKVCAGFEFITSGSGVIINHSEIDDRLKTGEMSDAAFFSILVNLISNSIKAVLAKGEREIKVTAAREGKLTIKVADKGIGLPEEKWNDVFLPLVTDPSGQLYKELYGKVGTDELAVLGKGTGLGLNIVKGMVTDNGGSVKFIQPEDGWSTCIEVKLA